MILMDCKGNELVEILDIDEHIGLMHLKLMPDHFSAECREEYGGLYGVRLQPEDLQRVEQYRQDREEIEKTALLKDISADERFAEIDRVLLNYYK